MNFIDNFNREFMSLSRDLSDVVKNNSEFIDVLRNNLFMCINGYLMEMYNTTYHIIDEIEYFNKGKVLNMRIYSNKLNLTLCFKILYDSMLLVCVYNGKEIFGNKSKLEFIDIDKYIQYHNLLKIIAVIKSYRDRHKYLTNRICDQIRYLPPSNKFCGGVDLLKIVDELC